MKSANFQIPEYRYLFAPVSLYILEAWPSVRRISSIFGLALILTALVTSSFATQVWHLIFTQGILYAIGGSFLYAPIMFYLDEWFIHRKGLAFGIMWAGVGSVGGKHPDRFTILTELVGGSDLPLLPKLSPQRPRICHHPSNLVRPISLNFRNDTSHLFILGHRLRL